MFKLMLISLLSIGAAACNVLPDTNPYQAQDAMIAAHKLEIADSDAAKAQATNDYYKSDQYRQALHANQFIAKNRSK